MKRLFLLCLSICLCMGLCACAATDPNNLFETTLGTEETQPDSDEVVLYTGAYQYGNMQKNLPPGDFMLIGNEVVFSAFRANQPARLSYNLLTGQVRYFCKDATCAHKDCAAVLHTNLEVYKGKLYGTRFTENGRGSSFELVAVNGNTVDVILDEGVGSFFHHEDKLYLKTPDSSLVVLEEGQKEPQMVLEEYIGIWPTIFGDYLYATRDDSFNIIRIDLTAENPQEEVLVTNAMGMTDGEYIYYGDLNSFQLYRCNMDGSEPLLIDEREVNSGSMNFDEEYFYYRLYTDEKLQGTPDCYDIYRFPKDDPTQIEKIATLPVPVWHIFTVPGTGKIFVRAIRQEGEDFPSVYILDCDGSNMKKLDIPE